MKSISPIIYEQSGPIAHITLNRPDALNAIDEALPSALEAAVIRANANESIRVIILSGAGRAFCAGYDLNVFAESPGTNPGIQEMPWDPVKDFAFMKRNTDCFMSLWRSLVPVICKVHGYAIAGGSDIALCADLLVVADNAQLGYPPAQGMGVSDNSDVGLSPWCGAGETLAIQRRLDRWAPGGSLGSGAGCARGRS